MLIVYLGIFTVFVINHHPSLKLNCVMVNVTNRFLYCDYGSKVLHAAARVAASSLLQSFKAEHVFTNVFIFNQLVFTSE